MNRLAPLIQRAPARTGPTGSWPVDFADSAPTWVDDLRLFATAWLGGLIFFGTLLA
jgi:hypothetical protein